MKEGVKGAQCILFEFGLMTLDGTAFESAFWLSPFMLGLDVGIESGIGEVSFAASAHEITSLFVLTRAPRCDLVQLCVALLLHSQIIKPGY